MFIRFALYFNAKVGYSTSGSRSWGQGQLKVINQFRERTLRGAVNEDLCWAAEVCRPKGFDGRFA